jgi:hypothetical protein
MTSPAPQTPAPLTPAPLTAPPALKRHPDWQPRLARYLALVARTAFQPGVLDCATFAAGAVEAMTGTDLAAGWRGYGSLEEGFQRLSAAGFDDHVALAASLLEEVPVAQAGPGDVAVLQLGRNLPSLGIVQGEFVYVLAENAPGLPLQPRSAMSRAFRVPQ